MSLRVRRALVGVVISAVVGATVLVPAAAQASGAPVSVTAEATDPGSPAEPAADPDPAAERPTMGDYPEAEFAAQAAEVSPDLAAAIAEGAGQTPEGYLANAAAAADAVVVVDGLADTGVEVLGSRLDGTELVVNVATDADAAAVEAVNATAEIGEPAAPDYSAYDFRTQKSDLVGGQGYLFTQFDQQYMCSVGFNGTDTGTSAAAFLTAGHCYPTSGSLYELVQRGPDSNVSMGSRLGAAIPGALHLESGYDANLIATDSGWNPLPQVGTWGGNAGPVTAGLSVIRDYSQGIEGQVICKSGRTSGWTCGHILAVDYLADVQGREINSYISDMCTLGGDSGGAVISGTNAIGLVSFGSYENCSQTEQLSGTFPLASRDYESVSDALPQWEVKVQASTPVVTTPGTAGGVLFTGQSLRGTIAGGSSHYSVQGTIDGAPVSGAAGSGGSWSIDLSGLSLGSHSYSIRSSFESGASVSAAVTGTFTLAAKPAVDRIQGADRYAVAVAIAEREFPGATTAPVVYVATGANYPDALSAGPAAIHEGGPLLLVTGDSIPPAVAEKIQRLAPGKIVIAGGPNSVSKAVENALKGLVPEVTVERRSGADRYEAGRAVVAGAFTSVSIAHAYSATGSTFPDALAAGAAAGSAGEPVVLVNGGVTTVPTATLDLFRTLGTSSISVVGGVNSVSPAVVSSLGTVPATVNRIDGADRFQAAVNLNKYAFASAATAYIATGYNFPDALSGAVLAGMSDSPLYVVPTDCVPSGVLADLVRLGVTNVVLLGGPNSLTGDVAALKACSF